MSQKRLCTAFNEVKRFHMLIIKTTTKLYTKLLYPLDDCIFGDQTIGIAAHHLTCAQIKLPANHYRCYDDYTRQKCCETCKSIKTSETGKSIQNLIYILFNDALRH